MKDQDGTFKVRREKKKKNIEERLMNRTTIHARNFAKWDAC